MLSSLMSEFSSNQIINCIRSSIYIYKDACNWSFLGNYFQSLLTTCICGSYFIFLLKATLKCFELYIKMGLLLRIEFSRNSSLYYFWSLSSLSVESDTKLTKCGHSLLTLTTTHNTGRREKRETQFVSEPETGSN